MWPRRRVATWRVLDQLLVYDGATGRRPGRASGAERGHSGGGPRRVSGADENTILSVHGTVRVDSPGSAPG